MSIPGDVWRAGEHAGLDRERLEAATTDPQIKHALLSATQSVYELGVIGLPTIAIDGALFWGDDQLQDAAVHVGKLATA